MRSHDIGVIGATGYTGRLILERISTVQPGVKVLAASRHPEHLHHLSSQLIKSNIKAWPSPVNTEHYHTVLEFARHVRVVIACAGPFYEVGVSIVKACVEAGTHYVDITGEVDFMRLLIDGFGARARIDNVLVVPACGFDSVPSDMGVFALQKLAPSPLMCATNYVYLKALLSGGTYRSLLAQNLDPARQRVVADAFALNDRLDEMAAPGKAPSKFESDAHGIWFDDHLHKWLSPAMMAPINTRVVRWTASLVRMHPETHLKLHPNFMYSEANLSPSLLAALVPTFLSYVLTPMKWFLSWPMVGRVLTWFLPASGQYCGPSPDKRRHHYFRYLLIGTCRDGQKVEVQVTGGDPYDVTAETVLHAAFCILQHEEALIRDLNGGGVFTPAYALGDRFLAMLKTSDVVKFETKGVEHGGTKGEHVDWESIAAS